MKVTSTKLTTEGTEAQVTITLAGKLPVIEAALLPNDIVVMDLVYNPFETRLLEIAAERGCKTVDGVGMLVHQGAEALRIWLGVDPPLDAMRDVVLDELKKIG